MLHAWMKVESQLKQIQVVLKERHSDLEAVFTFTCSDPVLQAASPWVVKTRWAGS